MAFSLQIEAQVAKCRNAIVVLSSVGNGSVTAAGINNGSSGYASLSVSPSSFKCSNVGPNVVTLTATAANGNTATCTGTVTVRDQTKPSAKCRNATVTISSDTTLSYMVVDDGSSDACGISQHTITPSLFTCQSGPVNVTLTVKDANNNQSTCTSVVTIVCSN